MTKIKFRGKSVDNGKWIYGGIAINDKFNQAFIVEISDKGYMSFREVVRETVGQFTGLFDKNGKEVFQGDAIDNRSAVIFSEGAFRGVYDFGKDDYWEDELRQCVFEVIGDIHSNPELIKE